MKPGFKSEVFFPAHPLPRVAHPKKQLALTLLRQFSNLPFFNVTQIIKNSCITAILPSLCLLGFLLSNPARTFAQHTWQKPKPLVAREQIEKVTGDYRGIELSQDRHVVWVWGYDRPHQPGAHDYLRIRDLMTGLLAQVPKLTVETAYQFPTQTQLENADLVVMYLHLPDLSDRQYISLRSYLEEGGGLVALHETAIIRPAAEGKKLAQCLGMSWDEGNSKWGAIFRRD